MKVGVLSDAHGNLAAFEACVTALGPVDALLFGGDVLGYYFEGAEVLRRLRALGAVCLAGNHDLYFLSHLGRPLVEQLSVPSRDAYRRKYGPALERVEAELTATEVDWLGALPCDRSLTLDGVKIRLVHGSPWRPADEYIYPDHRDFERFDALDAQVVIMGHTHRPLVLQRAGVTLLNPGSCGQPRDADPRAACALLELDGGQLKRCDVLRVPWDRAPLIERCRELAPDVPLLVELLQRDQRR